MVCFRLLVQLEETSQNFSEFWSNHERKLQQCLQLRQFEEEFKQVGGLTPSHPPPHPTRPHSSHPPLHSHPSHTTPPPPFSFLPPTPPPPSTLYPHSTPLHPTLPPPSTPHSTFTLHTPLHPHPLPPTSPPPFTLHPPHPAPPAPSPPHSPSLHPTLHKTPLQADVMHQWLSLSLPVLLLFSCATSSLDHKKTAGRDTDCYNDLTCIADRYDSALWFIPASLLHCIQLRSKIHWKYNCFRKNSFFFNACISLSRLIYLHCKLITEPL